MKCILLLLSLFSIEDYPQHTSAIIMEDRTEVLVQKVDQVLTKRYLKVMILNSQGEQMYGKFDRYYDTFTKIKRLEARVLDKDGKVLLSNKQATALDVALDYNNSGITDSRIKSISFSKQQLAPPYILEFVSEEESSQTFFYERWTPVLSSNVWIQSSTFLYRAPSSLLYRVKGLNLQGPSVKEKGVDYVQEKWTMKDFLPFPENASLAPNSLPVLYVQPGDYKIGNYKGTVRSWDDIGQFYLRLNEGRSQLPEITRFELQTALKGVNDPREKAKKVYEFMQKRTRYFNISFKLGGWQSVPVEQVATKGYGDCKGLTTFTLALLKEAGITAYPALVSAGPNELEEEMEDFPTASFNHIIACVPFPSDTLWLECTSQTAPAGYLGTFTGNRKALLITESGSKLVNTQKYGTQDNRRDSRVQVKLESSGAVAVKYQKEYAGTKMTRVWDLPSTKEAQRTYIQEQLRFNDPSLTAYHWTKSDSAVREDAVFTAEKGANVAGGRLFFQIFPFKSIQFPEEVVHSDKFYISPHTQAVSETVELALEVPAGYALETGLKDVEVQHDFGSYSYRFRYEGGVLNYTREVRIHAGEYAADQHSTWLDFLKSMQKMDRAVLVFKKV